jgi:hypothetical protein
MKENFQLNIYSGLYSTAKESRERSHGEVKYNNPRALGSSLARELYHIECGVMFGSCSL